MSLIAHIGLPDAGEAEIQHWFRRAAGVNYLGVGSGDEGLDRANHHLLVLDDFDPKPLREPYAAAAARQGQAVMSNPQLGTWRRFDPEESGERLAQFFPKPRVIYVVRRTIDWARARYFEHLAYFQRDTYAGINPWLEKHMSRLRVGSHIAPARWAGSLERFRRGAGADDVLILPYEMLQADRAGFIARIEAFAGLPGALAAVEAAEPAPPKRSLALPMANAYRVLGLRKREPERFMEMLALFNRHGRRKVQARFAELSAEDGVADGAWTAWFRTVKAAVGRAVDGGDEEVIGALGLFDDYRLRDGLAAYLSEIEAEETAKLLSEYGVDLRPYGYGSPAA